MRNQPDWVKGFWIAFGAYAITTLLFAFGTFVAERIAAQPYRGAAEPPVWVNDLSSYRAMVAHYLRGPALIGGVIAAMGGCLCLRSGIRPRNSLFVGAGLVLAHHLLVWKAWMPPQAWFALGANALGTMAAILVGKELWSGGR